MKSYLQMHSSFDGLISKASGTFLLLPIIDISVLAGTGEAPCSISGCGKNSR